MRTRPASSGSYVLAKDWDDLGDPVELTVHQRVIVDRAIKKAREISGGQEIDEGRALELICVDFLESFEE